MYAPGPHQFSLFVCQNTSASTCKISLCCFPAAQFISQQSSVHLVPRSVSSCCAESQHPNSCALSLGPSDSASQPTKFNVTTEKAVEDLLDSIVAPLVRPRCLPELVLWDYEDCAKDKSGHPITTKLNQSRPKLSIALHRPNGNTISNLELSNIRCSAEMIVHNLIDFIKSDPRSALHTGGSKSWTKTLVKKFFAAEYDQAILDLEAEQKILCLCSAHWKADTVITQVFLRRNEMDTTGRTGSVHSTSPHSNLSDLPYPLPSVQSIPRFQELAPLNAAKRAFESSPGPKSPSASHTQKRSKDSALISRQKAMGTRSNEGQRPAARNNTPTFLSRTEMVRAEPTPTSLRMLHVDPSADNLVAIITSDFPSLTDAPQLLRSMNAQSSFKQGEPSKQVTALLNRVQFADPSSPDIDEDNACQGWGHEQFTAGGLTLSSSLTCWQDIGNVTTAFKLVAAAIKMYQEARLMCKNAGTPKTSAFISDVYLEKTLECLESCWVSAGGVLTSQARIPPIPTTPSYRNVAMSPPRGLTIKLKWVVPATGIVTSETPEAPAGAQSTNQQCAASVELVGPSVGLNEGAHAAAASLKLLQVPELLVLFIDNKLSAPKWKRKDDLIAVILMAPELSHVLKSTITEIIEKRRKPKKGSPKQVAA
ncbi:hypothetical protein H4582DRAFT_2084322 [Lactarius indigo]|nr:hypothetical protein H4582DRAFT_2084322 [Lactarius indigo]